jgi:hypothetical protein
MFDPSPKRRALPAQDVSEEIGVADYVLDGDLPGGWDARICCIWSMLRPKDRQEQIDPVSPASYH